MLEIEEIHKYFGENKVLNGVSFSVDAGQIYGLIGKNGAGKTTLMNIMAGLSAPDTGRCLLAEHSITGSVSGASIGYLPDLPAFYDYLTVDEYIDFLLEGKNKSRKDNLIEMMDLPHNAKIATMSRGMRQRLGIAAAIINNPDVVLLDEPTSALDPSGRADVMKILLRLKEEGKVIVLSSHILADMERVCDKVGFLSGGTIKKELNVEELREGCSFVRVTFAEEIGIVVPIIQNSGIPFDIIDGHIFRFVIDDTKQKEDQKKVFSFLGKLDFQIKSIQNESQNLDKIFAEVCR